jgi:FAD/FMN-containing dehydrogenase
MKRILEIDTKKRLFCAQTGVITLDAIRAAADHDLLLTVDPASKAASSLGGNVAENAGGPFAFEYGTTIDNILSYKMVLPAGDLIEVRRKDHPRHKIMPHETAVFEVLSEQGSVMETVSLSGTDVRAEGLGKDVTNKFLGGLPGVQKEGVDGIITEACFTCYDQMAHSRVLCLEFFGRTMRPAMHVIKDVVGLRDAIRKEGDLVKISALEEFGSKYVQAIEYTKKSMRYEGEPISVLIMQLDSNDENALEDAARRIIDIVEPYDDVDVFAARDPREAEVFWEDRHRLSAISKRTSGFKIN